MAACEVDLAAVALRGRCPQCGHGSLLSGVLTLRDACPNCGFDLRSYQQGDGPAFFVIIAVCAIMTPLALWLAARSGLSETMVFLITGTLTAVASIALLRVAKCLLIALQYRQDAHEAVLDLEAGRPGSSGPMDNDA